MNKTIQYDTDRLKQFNEGLARRVNAYGKKKMTSSDWQKITKDTFFATFFWDIMTSVVASAVGETIAVLYSWYIG